MKKYFKHYAFIAITIASALFSGCGQKKTPVELGIEQQVLHKGNGAEPASLDPHVITGIPEFKIVTALFEGLIVIDSDTLKPAPGVAKSWEITNNGTVYTFFLREDAKWSNGDPLTADDFIFSFQRTLSKNLGSAYADTFYEIVNAEAYHKGELKDFSQVGFKALNAHTLQMTLKHPVPYLLAMMNTPAWYPVHRATILKHGSIDKRDSDWIRPGNMVSNGPFYLKEWEIGRSVVVEKNPYYWDKEIVRLNAIHFYPMQNLQTEERAFRTGQLHVTEALAHQKVAQYRKENAKELRLTPYFANYAYVFNTKLAPFNDKNVRRALSLAINRQSIIDNVTFKGELPAYSFTPPGLPDYPIKDRFHENVEEAKQLLSKSGYPNGENFPKITLLYNTSESHKSIAQALQHMWKEHLNIDVELINQEWKVYLAARENSEFNLIRFGWVGDYLDVNIFLSIFLKKSGNNFSGWNNPQYDALVEKANETLDLQKRSQLMSQAEDILIDEMPILPIYYYNTAYLVHPSVKNWAKNLMDLQNYKKVYLSE